MEGKKALSLNMIASMLVFIVNLGINFFLTPYLTEKVGTEAYGFVSLANNFVNYATIITIALNSMASRFITIAIHKDDEKEANKYFTSVFITNILIILTLVIPAVFVIFYLEKMFDIPYEIIKDVKLLFSLIFLNFFVSIVDSTYSIATFATNKLYLRSLRNLEGVLIKVAILIIAFSIFYPHVFYIGIATLISTIFLLITDLYYTKKLLPFVKIKKAFFSIKKVFELIKAGIWNTITKLGMMLTDGLDLVICNLMIDATSMGILAIAKTLGNVMSTLISTISSIFQPQFTIHYAKGNKNELVKELKTSMKISGFFANIPLAFIVVFGVAFYSLWTPEQDAQLLSILTILTIQGVIVSGAINPMYSIYTVTNKIKVDALLRIVLGILNVIIVYVLLNTTNLGIYVVAGVSTITGTIFNFIFVPIYTAKYCLNIKWYTFYPTLLRYIVTTVLMIFTMFLIQPLMVTETWFSLIATGGGMAILGSIINYIVLLNKQERNKLVSIVKKLGKRKENKI